MNKEAARFAATGKDAWTSPGYHLYNNAPWGFMTGGVHVPYLLYKLMPGSWSSDKESQRAALNTAATIGILGGSAILGAGLMGAARKLQDWARKEGLTEEGDNPAKGMGGKMSTTFELGLNKESSLDKRSLEIGFPGKLSASGFFGTAAAAGTMLLAAGVTDYIMDKNIEKARDSRITRKIKERTALYKDLITARALNARGGLSDKEYSKLEDQMSGTTFNTIKQASLDKEAGFTPFDWGKDVTGWAYDKFWDTPTRYAVGALGLLIAGVGVATAVGSHSYNSARLPGNIKYKAIKKGLREFSKGKSATSPITMLPPDDSYFQKLDQARGTPAATASPRAEEELQQISSKPILMEV